MTATRWEQDGTTHVRVELDGTVRNYTGDRYANFDVVIVSQVVEGGPFGVHGFRRSLVDATLEVSRLLSVRVSREAQPMSAKGKRTARRRNLGPPMRDKISLPQVATAFVVPIVDTPAREIA
jgi:hypothetical protein